MSAKYCAAFSATMRLAFHSVALPTGAYCTAATRQSAQAIFKKASTHRAPSVADRGIRSDEIIGGVAVSFLKKTKDSVAARP